MCRNNARERTEKVNPCSWHPVRIREKATLQRRATSSRTLLPRVEPDLGGEAPAPETEAPEAGHVIVKLLGRLAKRQQSPVLAQLVTGLQLRRQLHRITLNPE